MQKLIFMAAITSAVIGAGTAAYSIYNSEQKRKEAKSEMNEYERADLENAFENIQISTLGSDILKEETQRNVASLVEASQKSGTRGVISTLPKLQSYLNSQNQEIQKYLDDQFLKREYAISGDNQNLRSIKENRDLQNISAISSEYQSGEQGLRDGILGAISGAGSIGRAIKSKSFSQPDFTGFEPGESNYDIGIQTYNPGSILEKNSDYVLNPSITNTSPYGFNPFGGLPDIGTEFMMKNIFEK